MDRLLVICGPTATGKTSLGINIAKKFNGEIVSADSRQVYIGMDLGTGKDKPQLSIFNYQFSIGEKQIGYYNFDSIPVWMLDIVKPNQEFSVADYIEIASKIIKDIQERNKLPIIVGGTGLYIKALIDGIETIGIPPDWELRKNLEKKSVDELFEMLSGINSQKAGLMNSSDRRNPRRLIRAIEIALGIQKSKVKIQKFNSKIKNNSKILFIGLQADYKFLYGRVDKRIKEQIKLGAENEIKRLIRQGYDWKLPSMSAMGYGVWKPYFEKKENKEQIVTKWKYSEHNYIRRQMTWFKKDPRVNWFDISQKDWLGKVEELSNNWYNSKSDDAKN